MEIKRGDIWMVDFGPPEDDEDHLQHSIRPVVIVSNNRANEHSMQHMSNERKMLKFLFIRLN